MKIAMYDPYLDTLGGGEKYILTIADCLNRDHEIVLFWDDDTILTKARERFNMRLENVRTYPNIFSPSVNFVKKISAQREFDVLFFISDGSIPALFAKKNILIFQSPVNWVNGNTIPTKLKLKNVSDILCYSTFVKEYIDKTFSANALVLSPAIHTSPYKNEKKENVILSVGRFTKAMNTKKQEVLIESFISHYKKHFKNWKLVIIGSVLPKDQDYVEELKEKAKGFPIEIYENTSYEDLVAWYKKAKIYWHAAGFGEDLTLHPERAEHFGISTVEAMHFGAVPVVINAGGQKEIVAHDENGLLWDSKQDLIDQTVRLMSDTKRWEQLSEQAQKDAAKFGPDVFCSNVQKLIIK